MGLFDGLKKKFAPKHASVSSGGSRIYRYEEQEEKGWRPQYKLKYGMGKLDDVFREKKLPVILDLQRENMCEDFKEKLD